MRPQPLKIHLRRQADAECVVKALAEYPVNVLDVSDGWDVDVEIRSRSLGDVLGALHQCLTDNEIPLVRVALDGRTYAMEADLR